MATDRQRELLRRTFVDFTQTAAFLENPLIFEKADGLYCWDTEGKCYFDALGGVFVAVLGHRPQCVIEAMQRRLEGQGLDADVVDAAVARGLEALLLDHYQRAGKRVLRRTSLLDACAVAKA